MGEILSLGDLFILKLTKEDGLFFFFFFFFFGLLIYKFCDVAPLEVIHNSNWPKVEKFKNLIIFGNLFKPIVIIW
jgi:hypothetical protein